MNDCIFCKVIAGELPSWRVHEDENVIAILDLSPVNKGHTLVIPKKHCSDFVSADSECLRSVLFTAQKLARAVLVGTHADGCNITANNGAAAGQSIFHFHVHIIPRYRGDGFEPWKQGSYEEGEAEKVVELIKESLWDNYS